MNYEFLDNILTKIYSDPLESNMLNGHVLIKMQSAFYVLKMFIREMNDILCHPMAHERHANAYDIFPLIFTLPFMHLHHDCFACSHSRDVGSKSLHTSHNQIKRILLSLLN